ncbi:MAG TPA: pyridoxal-dependent decarboxylase [Candidatus Lumbricidophila sp.]|nr:pyridoxal-dependent decarboxylase [Candidatus Lumbricidophila sp.]
MTNHARRMHTPNSENEHLVDLVLDYARQRILATDTPLDHPMTPAELTARVGTTVNDDGIGADRALALFGEVLAPACITTDHPGFLSFMPCAPTKAATAFDLVVSACAVYSGSWLEGSGAVHAENEVLGWLAREFELPASAGGVFVQGGTLGNLSSLVAARDHALRTRGGVRPDRWRVVCSTETHSSVVAAAKVMDIEAVAVRPGPDGRLTGDAVRDALVKYGASVFAVVATAGSTNFGLIDRIDEIAALKDEFDFWLHVDGAYGLTGMLSPLVRAHFTGVAAADSLIVDPHKWMFAPFDACALIYRDPAIARLAHTQHAEYLDTLTDGNDWNPTDYAVHLTRRARGLPLWFSLASYGTEAYREAVTSTIEVAHAIADVIRQRPGFRLVKDPELSVVVFERDGWLLPDYDAWSARLLADGQAFVTPSSHAGRPNVRFAVLNPTTTVEQLIAILDTMV